MVDTDQHIAAQAAAVTQEPQLADLAAEDATLTEPTIVFQHATRGPYEPPKWAGALQSMFGVHRNAAPSHASTSLHPHVK